MKRAFIFPFLVVWLCTACATGKKVTGDNENQVQSLPFDLVAKGALFGGGQEGFNEQEITLLAIRTTQEWNDFKQKMDAVNHVSDAFQEEELDFNREMIIACVDRVRGSGGYEIRIKEIVENTGKLEVGIWYSGPPEMGASVLTQPYYIIRLARSAGSLVPKVLSD